MIYSDVETIADYFLMKDSMSPKKLQKIVYYAYSWTLALLNDPEAGIENRLFNDKFEGWVHGPVCPSLYNKYREFGWRDIAKKEKVDIDLPQDIMQVLDEVWQEYGGFTANELESITHQETPWKESRTGLGAFQPSSRDLKDAVIFKYYSEMAQA